MSHAHQGSYVTRSSGQLCHMLIRAVMSYAHQGSYVICSSRHIRVVMSHAHQGSYVTCSSGQLCHTHIRAVMSHAHQGSYVTRSEMVNLPHLNKAALTSNYHGNIHHIIKYMLIF